VAYCKGQSDEKECHTVKYNVKKKMRQLHTLSTTSKMDWY